jgi:tetratricopeptide (TPR) repeat protein
MPPDQLLKRGLQLHQAGHTREAERLYQQLLELEPANFMGLDQMGMIRLQQGQLREAQDFLEAALQVQPSAPETLVNYGVALSGLSRDAEALAALNLAIAVKPDDKAYLNRGAILRTLGRPEEALADFNRAIALDGRNAHALNNRALTLHGMGRLDEALSDFDRLLAMSPGSSEVRYANYEIILIDGKTMAIIADDQVRSRDSPSCLPPQHRTGLPECSLDEKMWPDAPGKLTENAENNVHQRLDAVLDTSVPATLRQFGLN